MKVGELHCRKVKKRMEGIAKAKEKGFPIGWIRFACLDFLRIVGTSNIVLLAKNTLFFCFLFFP